MRCEPPVSDRSTAEAHKKAYGGNPGRFKGIKPFAWTKREKKHPGIQGKLKSCVLAVKTRRDKVNP